jgi:hypothetical protein
MTQAGGRPAGARLRNSEQLGPAPATIEAGERHEQSAALTTGTEPEGVGHCKSTCTRHLSPHATQLPQLLRAMAV